MFTAYRASDGAPLWNFDAGTDAIVRGGARKALGMPSFGDDLNASQVRAIQAYVLSRAAAGR